VLTYQVRQRIFRSLQEGHQLDFRTMSSSSSSGLPSPPSATSPEEVEQSPKAHMEKPRQTLRPGATCGGQTSRLVLSI
jgi:hypothetical protein